MNFLYIYYNFGMLVVVVKHFNRNSILLHIYICVHMILYGYKKCYCKYKSLNFIADTDGELLKLIVKQSKSKISGSIWKNK